MRSKSRSGVRNYGQNIINNDNFFLGGKGNTNTNNGISIRADSLSTKNLKTNNTHNILSKEVLY